jgi:hypothetical protein
MPIVSGKAVSAQAVSNGSSNSAQATPSVAVGGSFTSEGLDVPSLSRLTWVIIQTAGVDSISVQPQVAFRRGAGNALVWENIQPVSLTVPGGGGIPLVLSQNTVAVQAMRVVLTHTGQQGAASVSAKVYLSGSA